MLKRVLGGCLATAILVSCAPSPHVSSGAPVISAMPGATPGSLTPTPPTPTPTSTPTKSVTPVPKPVELTSIVNFRDVAGTGLPTGDGKTMATGLIYRSAKLSTVTDAELKELNELGISNIYDLRTQSVAKNTPDPKIKGAKNQVIDLFAGVTFKSATSAAAAKKQAQQQQRAFVSEPARRKALAKLLKSFADAKGKAIIHCTEGKDRTGWVSAVFQLIAGVDDDLIIEQYVLSNEYRAQIITDKYKSDLAKRGKKYAQTQQALAKLDKSYIAAGLDELRTRYTDIDGYLKDGLGLTEETITKLRAKLVVG